MGFFFSKGKPNTRPNRAARMSIFMDDAEYKSAAKRQREKKAKYRGSKEDKQHRSGSNVPTARNGSKGWFS